MPRKTLFAVFLLAAPLIASEVGAERYPAVASCPDGSVIFAKKWADVRCEDAIRWSPGSTPRVGPDYYREAVRAREHEARRERYLDRLLTAAERTAPDKTTGDER